MDAQKVSSFETKNVWPTLMLRVTTQVDTCYDKTFSYLIYTKHKYLLDTFCDSTYLENTKYWSGMPFEYSLILREIQIK